MTGCYNAKDQGIVEWLISADDPSVRLAALRLLMDLPESGPEIQKAAGDVMIDGPIPKILSKQDPGGFWGNENDFYSHKYKGTIWNIILLANLGADGNDVRVRSAVEYMVKWSQHESGGFGHRKSLNGTVAPSFYPCLHGNMVWSMLRFGMKDDARVRKGLEWIARYQRFDDNEGPAPKGWPYKAENCWGKHTCHMGVIKNLKAISAVPVDELSTELTEVATAGAEHMLRHHLFKRSHDMTAVAKSRWTQLGFPLFWDTDTLEMLEVLADLGCRDQRMEDAVELVLSKRLPDGRWRNERSYAGRLLTNVEKQKAPSHWVTLKSLAVLRKLDRLD